MNNGSISFPLLRPMFTKIHSPNLASQTASVRKPNTKNRGVTPWLREKEIRRKAANVKNSRVRSIRRTWFRLNANFKVAREINIRKMNPIKEDGSRIIDIWKKIINRKEVKIFEQGTPLRTL